MRQSQKPLCLHQTQTVSTGPQRNAVVKAGRKECRRSWKGPRVSFPQGDAVCEGGTCGNGRKVKSPNLCWSLGVFCSPVVAVRPSSVCCPSAVASCWSGALSLSLFLAQFDARVRQFRWPSKGSATGTDSDRARKLASRKECRLVSRRSCTVQNSF